MIAKHKPLCLNRVILFFGIFFLSSLQVIAADIDWTGDGDGVSWSDPDNWDADAVPDSGDKVKIRCGCSITITLDSDVEVTELKVEEGSTLTIQTSTPASPPTITVTDKVEIKGKDGNTSTLILDSVNVDITRNDGGDGLKVKDVGALTIKSGSTVTSSGTQNVKLENSGATLTVEDGGVLDIGSNNLEDNGQTINDDGYISAANYTPTVRWTGDGDGSSWSDADNWNGDAVPISTDNVDLDCSCTVTISANASVNELTIESGSTLEIDNSVTLTVAGTSAVNGNLTISGTFDGEGDMTLDANSYVTVNSGAALDLDTNTLANYSASNLLDKGTVTANGYERIVLWTGDGDGSSWSDANNWSIGATPTSTDDVTINCSCTITVDANANVDQLTIDSGNTLEIDAGITLTAAGAATVNGNLTISGTFDGSADMTLGDNSFVTVNSGATLDLDTNTLSNYSASNLLDKGTVTANGYIRQVAWTGDGDGSSWSDADNWNVDAVPTSSDNTTIDCSCTVTVDAAANTDDLTVESGSTLEVSASITLTIADESTVNGNLTISGTVSGGDDMTLDETTTVTVNSGGTLNLGTNNLNNYIYATIVNNGTIVAANYSEAITWTGDGDASSWSDGDNWSGDAVPTSTDIVIVDCSCTVSVSADITVEGALKIESGTTINFNSNDLYVDSDAVFYNKGTLSNLNKVELTTGTLKSTSAISATNGVELTSADNITSGVTIDCLCTVERTSNLTMNGDVDFNIGSGTTLDMGGNELKINSDKDLTSSATRMTNEGVYTNSSELEFKGNSLVTNSGTMDMNTMHADGNLCNTGTIEVYVETFVHGGYFYCGGEIETPLVKFDDNADGSTENSSDAASIFEQNFSDGSGCVGADATEVMYEVDGSEYTYQDLLDTPTLGLEDDGGLYILNESGFTSCGVSLNILPIELSSFTLKQETDNAIQINWTTLSEQNNNFFAIQRSINGMHWEEVGKVDGAGNSSSVRYYEAEDSNPYSGLSYYRIKQVDFNGNYSFSSIRSINFERAENIIALHPNPVSSRVIVEGYEGNLQFIRLYNLSGQDVTHLISITQNAKKLNLNLSQIPTGIYSISIGKHHQRLHKK